MVTDPKAEEQAYVDWVISWIERHIANADAILRGAGDIGTHRALQRMRDAKVAAMRAARAEPLFGRLDLVDHETWYIGKIGVEGDDRDQAVVDWRSDVGETFYQADRVDPLGVGRRRTIILSKLTVTGVSEELLTPGFVPVAPELVVSEPPIAPSIDPALFDERSEPAPTEEPVQVVDAPAASPAPVIGSELRARDVVLEELERSRDGAMRDIVATIQADQDRLIRAAEDKALIVQGGPGTGKTVVGLHRAAWVLYQHRSGLSDASILIVGPNDRFIEYVRSVLPALGENRADHRSVTQLALSRLRGAESTGVELCAHDEPKVERLKGSAKMAPIIEKAVWSGLTSEPVSMRWSGFAVDISERDVESELAIIRLRRQPYSRAANALLSALGRRAAEQVGTSRNRILTTNEARDLSKELGAILRGSGALSRMVPAVDAQQVIRALLEDPAARAAAGIRAADAANLGRTRTIRGRPVPWTAADLPLLDEAAFVLRGRPTHRYTHVVVDEAQDLSEMQWRMVRRHTATESMTVLGDLAQATTASSPATWDEVRARIGVEQATLAELALGYRVPAQVMELAGRLLPEAAPNVALPESLRSGSDPEVVQVSRSQLFAAAAASLATRPVADGRALIYPAAMEPRVQAAAWPAGVALIADVDAKGLEYDHVVVLEPSLIAKGGKTGLRRLFIALTRSTKTLSVLHTVALPRALRDAQDTSAAEPVVENDVMETVPASDGSPTSQNATVLPAELGTHAVQEDWIDHQPATEAQAYPTPVDEARPSPPDSPTSSDTIEPPVQQVKRPPRIRGAIRRVVDLTRGAKKPRS